MYRPKFIKNIYKKRVNRFNSKKKWEQQMIDYSYPMTTMSKTSPNMQTYIGHQKQWNFKQVIVL